jgi:hypothetical protein
MSPVADSGAEATQKLAPPGVKENRGRPKEEQPDQAPHPSGDLISEPKPVDVGTGLGLGLCTRRRCHSVHNAIGLRAAA